jgi:hypothetical protein
LDVSQLSGIPSNLNMTNGAINVGRMDLSVSGLNLGGFVNVLNVAALAGTPYYYPTNIALIQATRPINGYNFVLGNLPPANPPYEGTLSQNSNTVVLTLTSGPLALVQGTVSFAPTNAGLVLNPAFCGLSYEKSQLTGNLFVSNDTSMIKMFAQIAPAVLRIGGNTVDTTCWGGVSNTTPITPAQVDAFAGFAKALPTNWQVIYGINMVVNSPANCAAEAAYVAKALGPRLLGFDIGNEPDEYVNSGARPGNYTFAQFLSQWQALAAAVTNTVPGWCFTNGGNGWALTGPASAYYTMAYTVPFAGAEAGVSWMVTQHYYRADGQLPSSTLTLLLSPDSTLPVTVSNIVAAGNAAREPLGFRMDECGSFYNGGAPNVSNGYGTALWALDFMFTIALGGGQGINFHGGGDTTGYTPIADNGTAVVQARPEFYGLKMFSLALPGTLVPAGVTLGSNINFSAYGIRRPAGGMSAVLNNKDVTNAVQVNINLGSGVSAAQWIELTGPTLGSTNGFTIGGAVINPDGSWSGGVQGVIPAVNGQLSVLVPPISAVLLNPVLLPATGTNITMSVNGNQLNLGWPPSYTGWLLQSNSAGLAMTNAWLTVPGSPGTNSIQFPIDPLSKDVFFRMMHP